MLQEYKYDKPAIKIFFTGIGVSEAKFAQLINGIEEEGIPYEISPKEGADAVAMAYQASLDSRLGVGLGINREEMVLHYEKLEASSPLFRIPLASSSSIMRALGANAARLVKKMPFKSL